MDRLLERAAAAYGIELAFTDNDGREHRASPETLRALLGAMAVPAGHADGLREAVAAASARAALPPVLVAAQGEDAAISVPRGQRTGWRLELEGGDTLAGRIERDGGAKARVLLPEPPPPGYHRLHLEHAGGREESSLLIVAPARCVIPADGGIERAFGLGCQIYGLRGERDLGVGDLADLTRLATYGADAGADFLALSPLHALYFADPAACSPYAPSHRAFLNWLLIAADRVPEVDATREIGPRVELVDYPATARRRRALLEPAFERFRAQHLGPAPTERGGRYRAFVEAGGEALRRHCIFEALHEAQLAQGPERWAWWNWPAGLQRPESPEVALFAQAHEERIAFFAWLQWLADTQLGEAQAHARARGMRVGLYRDLAVGVNPAGSLAWSQQDAAVRHASIGAPPDAFSPKGQNWGITPFAPHMLLQNGLEPWLADIRANMRHAGALRIDHAMGLRRLFWVPEGGGPQDGAYVRYPLEVLLAALALESHRAGCLVVAEDLGTVPRGFRPHLRRAGILSSRVFYFERTRSGGFAAAERYPASAVASIGTHDLPTLRGFLEARDIDWRERLRLFPGPEQAEAARRERAQDRERLVRLLRQAGLLPPTGEPGVEAIALALHRWLAGTPAALLMVQLEDLALAAEQPNLPGTVDEHPNWRRRLETDLAQLFARPFARELLAAVRAARRQEPPHAAAVVDEGGGQGSRISCQTARRSRSSRS